MCRSRGYGWLFCLTISGPDPASQYGDESNARMITAEAVSRAGAIEVPSALPAGPSVCGSDSVLPGDEWLPQGSIPNPCNAPFHHSLSKTGGTCCCHCGDTESTSGRKAQPRPRRRERGACEYSFPQWSGNDARPGTSPGAAGLHNAATLPPPRAHQRDRTPFGRGSTHARGRADSPPDSRQPAWSNRAPPPRRARGLGAAARSRGADGRQWRVFITQTLQAEFNELPPWKAYALAICFLQRRPHSPWGRRFRFRSSKEASCEAPWL